MKRQAAVIPEDFINAKVRGMRSKLLEGNRLTALADCKGLPELFRRVQPAYTFENHVAFERDLLADHIRQLDLISKYVPGRVGELFRWLLAYYQLENLKVALRAFIAKEPVGHAEAMMAPVPESLSLPVPRLFEAPDLRRFAKALPVAEYRDALIEEIAATGETPDPVVLDTALDKMYCEKLLQLCPGTDEWIVRLVAYDVDVRSLFLIFRAKFNYNIAFSEIEKFIVASGVYLPRKLASRLYAARDLSQAISAMPSSFLPREKRRAILSLRDLEESLLLQQYRLANRCFVESVVNISAVIAYYYIKRVEFSNVVRVTEGVRHGLPRTDIENKLLLIR
jgi:vacuolar-type H+-ATPase subunit C/Vma6